MPSENQTPPEASASEWKFGTLGYIWAAGAHGENGVIEGVQPVGLDLSFFDVLDALKFVFMGAAEVQHDRFVAVGDLMFVHLAAKDNIDIREDDLFDAKLNSRTAAITLIGGYRVVDKESAKVDLLAGGRLNFVKINLRLDGPFRTEEGSDKETWLDPVIAARARVPLGEKWDLALYGDIGGIVAGSDISWQTIGGVEYQIGRKMSLGGGWRVFKVHYEKGGFLYDVAQSGPMITLRTTF